MYIDSIYKAICKNDIIIENFISAGLIDALSTLTVREEKVLRMRHGIDDGKSKTLEEVCKCFNVTRERIRQIEAKAIQKLRHPSRMIFYDYCCLKAKYQNQLKEIDDMKLSQKHTLNELKDDIKLSCKRTLDELKDDIKLSFKRTLDELKKENSDINSNLKNFSYKYYNQILEEDKATIEKWNIKIEKILFIKNTNYCYYPRAYNALKRAGINTIGDIINFGNEIYKIRNIGEKTYSIICKLLARQGIQFPRIKGEESAD